MLGDYNQAEQKHLNDIEAQLKPSLDKAYEELNKAEGEGLAEGEELERIQAEYSNLLSEYEQRRDEVTRKAEAREARYFAKHTDNLTKRLIKAIVSEVAGLGMLQSHSDFQAIYQDDTELKKCLFTNYKQYFDILLKNDKDNYRRVVNFTDDVISGKEKIVQTYKAILEEVPVENPQSINMWDKPYLYLRQDNATNNFNKVARLKSKRGTLWLWDEQATYQQGNLTVNIPHYEQLLQSNNIGKNHEISTPTKKVLDIAMLLFSHNSNNPSIRFALTDYMKLCGLSDRKEARKQINTALEVLFDVSISYDDSKNKNKARNYRDIRLVDDKGIKHGVVYLHFAHAFAEMLSSCPVMPYPVAILQASKGTQNRNSYYIGRKISEHVYMNYGKRNERRIAVKTLLEAAPFLATEDEVMGGNRNLTDRIITPFMKDLEEALISIGIGAEGYELHYAGGERIPDDELEKLEYKTFISTYIWLDALPNYPSQAQRLETKAKIANRHEQKQKTKKGGALAQK